MSSPHTIVKHTISNISVADFYIYLWPKYEYRLKMGWEGDSTRMSVTLQYMEKLLLKFFEDAIIKAIEIGGDVLRLNYILSIKACKRHPKSIKEQEYWMEKTGQIYPHCMVCYVSRSDDFYTKEKRHPNVGKVTHPNMDNYFMQALSQGVEYPLIINEDE